MLKSLSFLTKGFLILSLLIIFHLGNKNMLFAEESATITATVSISICGNGVVEGGEICDSGSLNNLTCQSFGYEYGELRCGISCDEYEVSECSNSLKEIELETEIATELIPEEEVFGDETQESVETNSDVEIVNPEMNENETTSVLSDNVLIGDMTSIGNNISEMESPMFEDVLLTQGSTSKSPP